MRHRVRRSPAGFTLIELMVVIVILGLLIGIVGPNVQTYIVRGRIQTAKTQMVQFEQAIESYRLQHKGRLPDALEDLVASDGTGLLPGTEIPKDPWDNPYQYSRIDRKKYDILCLGGDGVEGGEDLEDRDIHLADAKKSGDEEER